METEERQLTMKLGQLLDNWTKLDEEKKRIQNEILRIERKANLVMAEILSKNQNLKEKGKRGD